MVFVSRLATVFLTITSAAASFHVQDESANRANKHKPDPATSGRSASKWYNEKTKEFWVNGTAIPEVPFDIGESYAGLLPISSDPQDDRTLYFWFFPSLNPNATTEVAVWLNGGPGCSSLSGLLTENGPFTWMEGTLAPVQNPYSWHNLTNMIWIEQPVGVGYTTGVPSISDEEDLGKQFVGFWKNFVNTFSMQDFSVYLTGESYAGFYVPYVADAFIKENDTEYYDLKGIAINNPIIGDDTTQGQVTVLPYAHAFNDIFYLNDTFLHAMDNYNSYCNYTSYMRKYLTFPPPQEPFPVLPDPYQSDDYECDVFDYVYAAVLEINPCFDIYHITATCPHLYSELGIVNEGDYHPPGAEIYFNRTDVKRALNAPESANWLQCTDVNVFANKSNRTGDYSAGHDTSPGPATNGVLQRVIEHTDNVIIGSGNLDFLLNTNGTLLAIQNMTWSGKQGLSSYPGKPFNVPYHNEYNGGALAGAGTLGTWGEERGLTFYQVQLAGHELPGYAAGAGYRVLEKLLGRIGDLGERSRFSTQRGEREGGGQVQVEMKDLLHAQRGRPAVDPRKQRLVNARSGGREEL